MDPRSLFVRPMLIALLLSPTVEAQVAIHPTTVKPAAWQRFALRVVNQRDTAAVAVRLTVPEVITVLGVERAPGWGFRLIPASDTTPQIIVWSDGELGQGEFREFAFLGRLAGDARRMSLVFPVRVTRADGSAVEWSPTGQGPAPVVAIVGTTEITSWGAMGLASAALGLAVIALALAVAAQRKRGPSPTGP